MYVGKLVFAQLMDFLPLHTFRRCVVRYPSSYPTKTFSHLDQYLCMAFAQLTFRESLRDIEVCLRAQGTKLYHLGIRGHVARSNLSDANEKRDWRIYRDLADALIVEARRLYVNDAFGVDLENTVYALDTTTIDLSLKVFPWAHFRRAKAAVKMHTQIDLRGNIPSFIHLSDGKMHEVNVLDLITPEPGSFTIMDRGFLDFGRLYRLTQAAAFFVIRPKSNTLFKRVYSRPVDKTTGLRCDQTVRLAGVKTQIWIAISAYVLVAIVKKRLGAEASLYTILQILSLALFEKTNLDQLLSDAPLQNLEPSSCNQLNLFSS